MTQTLHSQSGSNPMNIGGYENPFTATIAVPGLSSGKETLYVPGVIVTDGNPDFLEGYGWGKDVYFCDVNETVNSDGTPHPEKMTFIEDWLSGAVREAKTRDITSAELIKTVKEFLEDPNEPSIEVKLGAIVGYVMTCAQEHYGHLCPTCGAATGYCNEHIPFVTVPSSSQCTPRCVGSNGFPLDL